MEKTDILNKLIEEIYPIKMEMEELKFIQPRLLEIVDFYFERYGFGTKKSKPEKMIKLEKEYVLLRKRHDKLQTEYESLNKKIKDLEEELYDVNAKLSESQGGNK